MKPESPGPAAAGSNGLLAEEAPMELITRFAVRCARPPDPQPCRRHQRMNDCRAAAGAARPARIAHLGWLRKAQPSPGQRLGSAVAACQQKTRLLPAASKATEKNGLDGWAGEGFMAGGGGQAEKPPGLEGASFAW